MIAKAYKTAVRDDKKRDKSFDPSSQAPETLSRLLKNFEALGKASRKDPTPKTLHAARVNTRRLLVFLSLFRETLPEKEKSKIEETAHNFLKETGQLSDLQVGLKRLKQVPYDDFLKPFIQMLTTRQTAIRGQITRRLANHDDTALQTAVTELIQKTFLSGARADTLLIEAFYNNFPKKIKELLKRVKRVERRQSKTIHRLRIGLREVRYHLEIVKPYFGGPANKAINICKELQTTMGNLHDDEWLLSELERFVDEHPQDRESLKATLATIRQRISNNLEITLEKIHLTDRINLLDSKHKKKKFEKVKGLHLILFRHGTAVERDTKGVRLDALRPLVACGRSEILCMADFFRRTGIKPDRVFTSPFVRACQSAILLCGELGLPAPIQTHELSPGGLALNLVHRLVENAGSSQTIILIGHEPDLSRLASSLTGNHETFNIVLEKGGAMGLRITQGDNSLREDLLWSVTPLMAQVLCSKE